MWRIVIVFLLMLQAIIMPWSVRYVLANDPVVTLTVRASMDGIENFTVIYVNDNQVDFTWEYGTNAIAIMIRGKYGSYPEDIVDINTEPSDGFLIYSGNTTNASWYFDENISPIFVKAWGQREDGTWFIHTDTGIKEGFMTLFFFLVLPLGLTYIASRSSYYILRFIAGGAWWGLMAYWLVNRPSSITAGSAVDSIVVILLLTIGLAVMFMTSWTTRTVDGVERGGFNVRLPIWLGGQSEEDELAERRNSAMTSRTRRDLYRERANSALRNRRIR